MKYFNNNDTGIIKRDEFEMSLIPIYDHFSYSGTDKYNLEYLKKIHHVDNSQLDYRLE